MAKYIIEGNVQTLIELDRWVIENGHLLCYRKHTTPVEWHQLLLALPPGAWDSITLENSNGAVSQSSN